MKNTNTTSLAPEIVAALYKYNSAIDGALAAVQKLEYIAITAHLAEFFWVPQEKTALILKQDYLVIT